MSDRCFIGLMSGTSLDGIDAVLVDFQETGPKLLASHQHNWPSELQYSLRQISQMGQANLNQLGQLDAQAGETFAAASLVLLEKAGMSANDIMAIGSHGQTLRHGPSESAPFSMQIGDPNRIAELTGITTVGDFRRRDMAAGGQGAPLVPAFHQAIFSNTNINRCILNIGGIANITLLPAGQTVSGFDTGPGNCLLDRWIEIHKQLPYDKDGDWARKGQADILLMEKLLEDAYFSLPPPKSTGTEYFSVEWLTNQLAQFSQLSAADVQATLTQLTTQSIARALSTHAPEAEELLVCGGGVHNSLMMEQLASAMPNIKVSSTGRYGVDPDWVEAMAFAWLAQQTLSGKAGNLPGATGARHEVILGGIYQGKAT